MRLLAHTPALIALAVALLSGGTVKTMAGFKPSGIMALGQKVELRCAVQAFEPGAALQRVLVVNEGEGIVPEDMAIRFTLHSSVSPPVAAFAKAPRPIRPGGSLVVKEWFVAADKAQSCDAWFMAPLYRPDHPGL